MLDTGCGTQIRRRKTIIVPWAEDNGGVLCSVFRGKSEQQSSIDDSSDTDSHKQLHARHWVATIYTKSVDVLFSIPTVMA